MSGVNKVILVGHLGADPTVRATQTGTAVCNFNLATTERFKDKTGERQERTEWHRVVTFARLAEICGEYLKKGKQVYVEGRLQTRSWEDQQGQKKYMTEIVANNMTMLGRAGEAGADVPSQSFPSDQESVPQGASDDDDLPF